jgi:hypothetical protein
MPSDDKHPIDFRAAQSLKGLFDNWPLAETQESLGP